MPLPLNGLKDAGGEGLILSSTMEEAIVNSLSFTTDFHVRITAHYSGPAANVEDFLLPFLVVGVHHMETDFEKKLSQKRFVAIRTMGSMNHNEVLQDMYERAVHHSMMPLIGKAALAQIVNLTRSGEVKQKHTAWLTYWESLRGEGVKMKALQKATYGTEEYQSGTKLIIG